jgi:hypothetical protein
MGVATPTICEVPLNSEYFLILTGDTEIQIYLATGKHSNEVRNDGDADTQYELQR